MHLSVILSTYNSPAWLEKVLWGYHCQQFRDFDLIIADDGSQDETRHLIDRFRDETGLGITHLWQKDQGFRKCRILNKAVRHVAETGHSSYLVFSDGDCIPRQDFLATHAAQARPGYYLAGSYYKLPMETSQAITPDDIQSQRCFSVPWLQAHGLTRQHGTLKLRLQGKVAEWGNRLSPVAPNFKGANSSVWLQDALKVNGFDERMPWGGEDREFGVRLRNAGIKARHVRYSAVCIHLDHARGYVDPAMVAANKRLRQQNEKQGVSWTDHGISALGQEKD